MSANRKTKTLSAAIPEGIRAPQSKARNQAAAEAQVQRLGEEGIPYAHITRWLVGHGYQLGAMSNLAAASLWTERVLRRAGVRPVKVREAAAAQSPAVLKAKIARGELQGAAKLRAQATVDAAMAAAQETPASAPKPPPMPKPEPEPAPQPKGPTLLDAVRDGYVQPGQLPKEVLVDMVATLLREPRRPVQRVERSAAQPSKDRTGS